MLIPIPTGRRYTSRVQTRVERRCTCEKCGNPFTYAYTVSGIGVGLSRFWLRNAAASQDAKGAAERALKENAQVAFPPYPCPTCGAFQSGMIHYFRQTRLPRLFRMSRLLLAVTVPLALLLGAVVFQDRGMIAAADLFLWVVAIPGALLGIVLLRRRYAMPKVSKIDSEAPP